MCETTLISHVVPTPQFNYPTYLLFNQHIIYLLLVPTMDHGQYESKLKQIWIGVHGYISKLRFRHFELVLILPLLAVGLDLLKLDEHMA